MNQDWVVIGRDRIWWRLKKQPTLHKLQAAGAWVRLWSNAVRALPHPEHAPAPHPATGGEGDR